MASDQLHCSHECIVLATSPELELYSLTITETVNTAIVMKTTVIILGMKNHLETCSTRCQLEQLRNYEQYISTHQIEAIHPYDSLATMRMFPPAVVPVKCHFYVGVLGVPFLWPLESGGQCASTDQISLKSVSVKLFLRYCDFVRFKDDGCPACPPSWLFKI